MFPGIKMTVLRTDQSTHRLCPLFTFPLPKKCLLIRKKGPHEAIRNLRSLTPTSSCLLLLRRPALFTAPDFPPMDCLDFFCLPRSVSVYLCVNFDHVIEMMGSHKPLTWICQWQENCTFLQVAKCVVSETCCFAKLFFPFCGPYKAMTSKFTLVLFEATFSRGKIWTKQVSSVCGCLESSALPIWRPSLSFTCCIPSSYCWYSPNETNKSSFKKRFPFDMLYHELKKTVVVVMFCSQSRVSYPRGQCRLVASQTSLHLPMALWIVLVSRFGIFGGLWLRSEQMHAHFAFIRKARNALESLEWSYNRVCWNDPKRRTDTEDKKWTPRSL